jgi:malate dehydrogenase (oxaloacetate-decarboxylating)
MRWTNGAAVMGTGSPLAPVEHEGRTHTIGQANNAFIFPGLGLGAIAVEAHCLPDDAFVAAARALVGFTAASPREGSPIYPPLSQLRDVSRDVALAAGASLVESGAAPTISRAEIERRVLDAMWEPDYLPYRAATREIAIEPRATSRV